MAKFPNNMQGLLRESSNSKMEYKRAWDLSLLFLQGNQWLSYDNTLGRYEMVRPKGGGNSRVTINLLLNIYRNILSRLTVNYPSMAVMPASASTEDIAKAKATELFLEYHWNADDIKDMLSRSFSYLISSGTVAIHTYFDPQKDMVTSEPYNAYDIFFEADVSSPDESSWIALRTFHTKEELKKAYPDEADFIEDAPTASQQDSPLGRTRPKGRVEVYEVYWRDGRHAIMTGSKYLFKEEDASVDPFPVQIIRFSEIPTRAWGIGLIEPLVDLQWFYNKARSQIVQNAELMANPKILIPKTAGVPTNAFTDRPGEKIYYNAAGGEPRTMSPAPLPGYILDNITRIQSEMGDVSGLHSVSLGKRAVNVSSGAAIKQLSERDLSQLHITQTAIEKAVRNMAKTVIILAKAHYSEKKMIRMMDDFGRVIHEELSRENIVDDPEVFLQAGSLFRKEAHDRDAKVMELFNLGLIDKETAMFELSFRTSNSRVSEKVRSLAHAQQILDAVKQGYAVEIYATDDLDAFGRVFKEFMQSNDYYGMPVEQQNYVSDVYTSIVSFGKGQQVYDLMMKERLVFPKEIQPGLNPQQTAQQAALPQSEMAEEQVSAEAVTNAADSFGAEESVSRISQRSEALISPFGGNL